MDIFNKELITQEEVEFILLQESEIDLLNFDTLF